MISSQWILKINCIKTYWIFGLGELNWRNICINMHHSWNQLVKNRHVSFLLRIILCDIICCLYGKSLVKSDYLRISFLWIILQLITMTQITTAFLDHLLSFICQNNYGVLHIIFYHEFLLSMCIIEGFHNEETFFGPYF